MKIKGDNSKISIITRNVVLEMFKSIEGDLYWTFLNGNELVVEKNDVIYNSFLKLFKDNNLIKLISDDNRNLFVELKKENGKIIILTNKESDTLFGSVTIRFKEVGRNNIDREIFMNLFKDLYRLRNESLPDIMTTLKSQGNIVYIQDFK